MKKVISLILAIFMIFGSVIEVSAEENTKNEYFGENGGTGTIKYTAPWYEGEEELGHSSENEKENVLHFVGETASSSAPEYLEDKEKVADIIRKDFVARKTNGTYYYKIKVSEIKGSTYDAIVAAVNEICGMLFLETDSALEGDYLYRHINEYYVGFSWAAPVNGYYRVNIDIEAKFNSSAEQEAELTVAIENLKKELGLSEMGSDYEKVNTIYDYIAKNVRYDWTNLNNSNYKLKYSAYAALINKTAVCQGYASLLYRILREEGISSRIIGSVEEENHAWNIIEVDELYYNADVTWDEGRPEYSYFLMGEKDFPKPHTRSWEYDSAEFHETYPMSRFAYDPANAQKYTYTVTYDANGGENAPEAQTKVHGEEIVLSKKEPVFEGREFLGWATDASAEEAEYQSGESYTANKNLVLYAVWGESGPIATGYCGNEADGKNLEWEISHDGVLTIKGAGAMADYDISENSAPWKEHSEKITKIVVEDGITYIGRWAFAGCENVSGTFVVPATVEKIGRYAFADCGYETVEVSSSVKEIEGGAFSSKSIKNIGVDSSNENYCSVDGILFTKDMKAIVAFPAARDGSYTVPETVETVEMRAFEDSSLKKVVLPENVKTIRKNAFLGFNGTVTVEGQLDYIERQAFMTYMDTEISVYFMNGAPEKIDDGETKLDKAFCEQIGKIKLYYLKGTEDKWEFDDEGLWNGYSIEEYDPDAIIIGDANGDGNIDTGDSQRLYEHIVGSNPVTDEGCLRALDVNGDGNIDTGDSQRLYEHIVGSNPLK